MTPLDLDNVITVHGKSCHGSPVAARWQPGARQLALGSAGGKSEKSEVRNERRKAERGNTVASDF
jgi:hypothetical protein